MSSIEPKSNRDEFYRVVDNAILTPHIGGSTQRQENIVEVAEKLVHSDGSTLTSKLLVTLHTLTTGYHVNVPGAIGNQRYFCGKSNQYWSRSCKPLTQWIRSNRCRSNYSEVALEKLSKIIGTMRCRVLY